MPRTYVDNSYNRSVGRVGMDHGSAVMSSSSSGSGHYASSSGPSSSSRAYVDNSYNRSAGRVGMPVGSAVVSSSSRDTSAVVSSSSRDTSGVVSSSSRDTSGVVSSSRRDTSGSSSSSRAYVDNSYNRSAGRVGKPVGSAVISSDKSTETNLKPSIGSGSLNKYGTTTQPKRYVDNAANRRLGRVGKEIGNAQLVSCKVGSGETSKVYVDNETNRILGRVGLPYGSSSIPSLSQRKRGVNSPQTALRPRNSRPTLLRDLYDQLTNAPDDEISCYNQGSEYSENQYNRALDKILDTFKRAMEIRKWKEESKCEESPKTSSKLLKDFSGAQINFQDIDLRGEIGQGSFGVVHVAKYEGTIIAVKKLRVQRVSQRRLKTFTEELHIMCALKHPNVVRFIGACVVTPNLCICMEYMKASLYDSIHMQSIEFSNEEKTSIIMQIAGGLTYLHNKQVIHCDIKSQNVLLDYEKGSAITAKLTDFGLSMMKNDAETSVTSRTEERGNLGTPRYSAPEVLRGEMLNMENWKCADIYSFSLVIYEIICESEPFEDLSVLQLTKQVGENNLMLVIPQNIDLDEAFQKILVKCWDRDPKLRPTSEAMFDILQKKESILRNLASAPTDDE